MAGCQGAYLMDVITALSAGPIVYTAGYYVGTTKPVACYFAGAEQTVLPGGFAPGGAYAYSIYVSGGTVYTAGYYYDGTRNVACCWTNGTKTDLAGGFAPTGAYALSICVAGGTVYAAGYYHNGTTNVACCWMNGTKTDLPGSAPAAANSICVSGRTVYAAGYCDGGHNPCYWTNGTKTGLNGGGGGGTACSIYVSGSTVYIAGYYNDGAWWDVGCYWMNNSNKGRRTDVIGAGRVYSIFVPQREHQPRKLDSTRPIDSTILLNHLVAKRRIKQTSRKMGPLIELTAVSVACSNLRCRVTPAHCSLAAESILFYRKK